MTHREYRMRLAWVEERYNRPDKSDYYLMQIAAEVAKVLAKKPEKIKLEQFKLSFGSKKKKEQVASQAESKSFWYRILGLNRNKDES